MTKTLKTKCYSIILGFKPNTFLKYQ